MSKVFLENEQATIELGSQLAESIKSCSARNLEIHLHGDLGAGKTFISRSIIQSSGWSGLVKSPTYTLCEEYDLNEILFLHIDLYRSEDIEDIDRSVDKKKVVIIEWPEKLKTKRDPDMEIFLEHKSNKREVSVKIHSQKLLETINL
jgi:tRNA threonylcarbamoyladenosine biosynthesis protein TsaE